MSNNRALLASYVDGINTERNFCLNPNARKNTNNVTDADSIVTRDTTDTLDGVSSFAINADASGEKALFLGTPFTKSVQGGNCEAKFKYFGDASLYKAYVQLDTSVVSSEVELLNVTSGSQEVSMTFVCGTSATDVPAVVVEATNNSAAEFNMGEIYIGRNTGIGSVAQAEILLNASKSGDQVISSTSATTVVFETANYDPYGGLNTTTGVYTVPKTGRCVVSPSLKYTGITAGEVISFTVQKNGTNQPGGNFPQHIEAAVGSAFRSEFPCASGDLIQVQSDSLADSSYTIQQNDGTNFQIMWVPTASEQVQKVGFPGQEWTSYTPTTQGLGTISSVGFEYQCIQGNVYIQAEFTTGTTIATEMRVGLPTGMTIGGTSGKRMNVGNLLRPATSTGGPFNAIAVEGRTYLTFGVGSTPQGDLNGNSVVGNSENIVLKALVPVTADSPCPRTSTGLFKNAVTTSSEGVERIERANLTCSSSSSVNSQSGTWITSIGNVSSGACAVTFSGSPFSSNSYSCSVMYQGSDSATERLLKIDSKTTSGFNIVQIDPGSGYATSVSFDIICMGPN